jgi:asparagine synthase (glutamine-hydrolysing)
MCGINGYFDFSKSEDKNSIISKLKLMNESIKHRGPDGGGELVLNNYGIAMKRLSIIDLSLGNQPMTHPDYNISIVFNGEIYNYKELKEALLKRDYKFYTNSDTEVIIVAYVAYGLSFIDKLKGMFAFCLIDNNSKISYIFRDRAGEKPLYYMQHKKAFLFSSELKGLLSVIDSKLSINKIALNQYFQLSYIPSPLSIFEGINKLRPGHFLRIKDINIEEICYWKLNSESKKPEKTLSSYSNELFTLMDNSVEGALVSDVPIGVFLSGGIDSSIITALAARKSKKQLQTFTVKFNEKAYDESKRAKIVATKYKTKHIEILLSEKEILKYVNELISFIDEPFADSSLLPAYAISKEARKYVKTVITGDGADELFAGYNKYTIFHYSKKYNEFPKLFQKIIQFSLSLLNKNSILYRNLSKVVKLSKLTDVEKAIALMIHGFNSDQMHKLFKPSFKELDPLKFIKDQFLLSTYDDTLGKVLNIDFNTILEGDMLNKMDRASMYASLETRSPFLDNAVIEFANILPSNLKLRRNNKKYILKHTFSNLLPKKTVKFTKKGFSVPISLWFKTELKYPFEKILSQEFISKQGIFNFDFINKIFNDHINNNENYGNQLWTFFIFQKWYLNYQKFINN